MNAEAQAHLLVIDGDERLRDLLRQYLKTQGFLVSAARDVAHARRLLSGLEFDLVVMDAGLSEAPDLCEDLTTPILAIADKSASAPDKTDVIAKPFEPKVLCEKIRARLGQRPPSASPGPRLIVMGEMQFEPESGRLTRGTEPIHLTATELGLMRLFATRPGEAFTRAELVAGLGREGLSAKARAVDVQVTRLRRKLEDDPRAPRYLQTVRGAGYMLAAD